MIDRPPLPEATQARYILCGSEILNTIKQSEYHFDEVTVINALIRVLAIHLCSYTQDHYAWKLAADNLIELLEAHGTIKEMKIDR